MRDLHELPRLRDSLSYLYVEKAVVNRKDHAVEFIDEEGRVMVPAASLCVLLLGPGTSITHAAVKVLADNGCTIVWTGEDATQCYGQGLGETRKGYHLLRQAELASISDKRMEVVVRMYRKRFKTDLDPTLSIEQIRGLEGVRVRRAYAEASRAHGVAWSGRRYDRSEWRNSDPINRALSAANALLNGLCHAAIVSGGYSPGLGFIHTGKQLSFVYDIADLYKVDLTIPTAFRVVAASPAGVESRVRQACRDCFRECRLLERILPDIDELLGVSPESGANWVVADMDEDPALPQPLWTPAVAAMEVPVT
jgi:CRISPR-associated protein Cas1